MVNRKLNDDEVRCLRKIFVTWLKKEGYYEDYIEAKMHLKLHYHSRNRDGWPRDLNESEMYNNFNSYSDIIDQTIDYYRCSGIRSDWRRINDKWHEFVCKHEPLIVSSIYKI